MRSEAASISPGYFVGVGSNDAPAPNLAAALGALAERFGCLYASAIHLTEPVAVQGEGLFRNIVLYLPTAMAAPQLKSVFNELETALGRDRTDPRRKWIARPVDLDILASVPAGASPLALCAPAIAAEPYFRVALPGLLAYLGGTAPGSAEGPTETLHLAGRAVGSAPFTLCCEAPGRLRVLVHPPQLKGVRA